MFGQDKPAEKVECCLSQASYRRSSRGRNKVVFSAFCRKLAITKNQQYIKKSMSTLFIIRGHSGSGKSTLARSLKKPFHFEADMFFQDKSGDYRFDPARLPEAHDWCIEQVRQAMSTRKHIVVSNTFIKKRDVRPYFVLAKQNKYRVLVFRCIGEYDNLHGVPQEKILFQKKMYELFHFENVWQEKNG